MGIKGTPYLINLDFTSYFSNLLWYPHNSFRDAARHYHFPNINHVRGMSPEKPMKSMMACASIMAGRERVLR